MLVKYPIMDLSITRDCFAICGGGGSLKSGIRNTVDIYELSDTDPSGFEKTITADTGLELASGVAFSHDGQLIAVSVNASCWIYALDREAKTLTLLVKFRSDFADVESSQTSVCFVGNSTLLTGGEDGVVRVWRLTTEPSPKEKAKGTSKALDVSIPKEDAPKEKPGDKKTPPPSPDKPTLGDFAVQDSYMATLTREYRGHTKRIREIHVEPSHRNLVVSSSEDQSCHLWRLNEFTAICRFSKDDAVDVAYQQLKMKPLVGAKKHQFRCVRFANDGRALYTVLTPARGDTLLLKWTPSTRTQTRENEWLWVVEAAVVAGDRPVGSLCLSDDDRFVSTASVAGDVRVYEAAMLQPYKKTSQFEHNFAITGMGFLPASDRTKGVVHLITGGADKQLLRHDVPLQGGAVSSGLQSLVNGIGSFLAAIVNLALSSFMGMVLLFVALLFTHANNGLLLAGPTSGIDDLVELRFDSVDAQLTLALTLGAIVVTWVSFVTNTVANSLFWNGVLCVASTALSFFVAVSPELALQWKTGDAPFDELLDYKISIILGACSIVFFFLHSLLAKLR